MEEDEGREAENGPLRAIWAVVRSWGFISKGNSVYKHDKQGQKSKPNLEAIFQIEIKETSCFNM